MESLTLAIYLFAIIFGFLIWIVTPIKVNQDSASEKPVCINEIPATASLEIANTSTNNSVLKNEMIAEETDAPETSDIQEKDKIELPKEEKFDPSLLKTYKLHGHITTKTEDLPPYIQLPPNIKRYRLRGFEVIRIFDLQEAFQA